jgi:hypothetical protein
LRRNIAYVFIDGYTAQGYYSFLPTILHRLQHIFILNGKPGSGKSAFIKHVGLTLADRGYNVQFWSSPLDPTYLDGVYLSQLKTAIISGDMVDDRAYDFTVPTVHNIYLDEYQDQTAIGQAEHEIQKLTDVFNHLLTRVTWNLEEALETRAGLAEICRALPDPNRLGKLRKELSQEIIGSAGTENHYFAQAITSLGVVEYYEELSKDCQSRYILQGPPGVYKSGMLYRLAEDVRLKGYQVSYYHSALDPETLEMVIIDGLQSAIINGEVVYGAIKPGDKMIDLTHCFDQERPDGNELAVSQKERHFSHLVYEAIQVLIQARIAEQKISKFVTKAMMFERVDACREQLIEEILNLE